MKTKGTLHHYRGTPAQRMAVLKKRAQDHNDSPHTTDEWTWRDARFVFDANEINKGTYENQTVWWAYSIDKFEEHFRKAMDSVDGGGYRDIQGYYGNYFQGDIIRFAVFQLPNRLKGRKGTYVGAIYADEFDMAMLIPDLFDDPDEAYYHADRYAERYAEGCCEGWLDDQQEQAIYRVVNEIEDLQAEHQSLRYNAVNDAGKLCADVLYKLRDYDMLTAHLKHSKPHPSPGMMQHYFNPQMDGILTDCESLIRRMNESIEYVADREAEIGEELEELLAHQTDIENDKYQFIPNY